MTERNMGQKMEWWVGRVINITDDPYQSGRAQVRIVGRHTDQTNIPDDSLPWALPLMPVTSASTGRIGQTPGLIVGSTVSGFWADPGEYQYPIIWGSFLKAGDEMVGAMTNNAPAINATTGSIPTAVQGVQNNWLHAQNPNRPDIAGVVTGQVPTASVSCTAGTSLTAAAISTFDIPALPTIGSVDKKDTSSVLDLVRKVDPLGTLSSLPCFDTGSFSLRNLIRMALGTVGNMLRGLVDTIVSAIKNAILSLARSLGIFKVLGFLNSLVANVKSIQNLISALNLRVCGVNVFNQGLFKEADMVLASVVNGLNTAVGAVVGGLSNVINTVTGAVQDTASAISNTALKGIDNLLSSVPSTPEIAKATDTSAVPPSAPVKEPPPTYVQQYVSTANDPFPGYIQWKDPSGSGDPVYTLRGNQPNYSSAEEHMKFETQNQVQGQLGPLLSSGTLSFASLSSVIQSSMSFARQFAAASVLGSGLMTLGPLALGALIIPAIATGVQNTFDQKKSAAVADVQDNVNNYMQKLATLKQQRDQAMVAVNSAGG